MRGNQDEQHVAQAGGGSIPAYAGEPYPLGGNHNPPPVYPRVCGGTHKSAPGRLRAQGLSPRMRGNLGMA